MMVTDRRGDLAPSSALVGAHRTYRPELGSLLLDSSADQAKYAPEIPTDPEARVESIRIEQCTFVDREARSFETADPSFRAIDVGIKLMQFSWPGARLKRRASVLAAGKIQAIVDGEFAEVARTLDLITATFECPIFDSNTANVRRLDSTAKDRLKNIATR